MAQVEYIAVGSRDAMIAEYASPEWVKGRWFVQPYGEAQFDTEGFGNKKDAFSVAKELAAACGVKVVTVY